MSYARIATITKMVETLPDPMQERVADHLMEYIQQLQDEMKWDQAFDRTQSQLSAAAKQAKQQIENGAAIPLDERQL